VDLSGADLTGADLRGLDLNNTWSGVRLNHANLSGANLTGADLSRRNLRDVNLTGANLTGANLTRSDLPDLTGANLTGAVLTASTTKPPRTTTTKPPRTTTTTGGPTSPPSTLSQAEAEAALEDASNWFLTESGCYLGMNLQDCEYILRTAKKYSAFGLSTNENLFVGDCKEPGRFIVWTYEWWIIDLVGAIPIISRSPTGCS